MILGDYSCSMRVCCTCTCVLSLLSVVYLSHSQSVVWERNRFLQMKAAGDVVKDVLDHMTCKDNPSRMTLAKGQQYSICFSVNDDSICQVIIVEECCWGLMPTILILCRFVCCWICTSMEIYKYFSANCFIQLIWTELNHTGQSHFSRRLWALIAISGEPLNMVDISVHK